MIYKPLLHSVKFRFSYLSYMLLLLLIMYGSPLKAQAYVSPGVQLSMDNKYGFTFSLQVTIGHLMDFGIPGVTLGVRTNRVQSTTFADLQYVPPIILPLGPLEFATVGFGYGVATVTDRQSKSIQRMKRGKAWFGAIGLLAYDIQWNENEKQNNFGLMGVLPMPLGDPGIF